MAEEKKSFDGKWVAIGAAIGIAIGAVIDNMPLGLCIGVGLGGTIALAEQKKNKNKEEK